MCMTHAHGWGGILLELCSFWELSCFGYRHEVRKNRKQAMPARILGAD